MLRRQSKDITFSKQSLRRIFREHRGAALRLAAETGRTRGHISRWLKGERDASKEVIEAAQRIAIELLTGGKNTPLQRRGIEGVC